MATSFTRSTRSLQDIDFRKSVINLTLILVIIGLWGIWFFFASIALYEISAPIAITQEEIVVVNFPLTAQGRLQRGQQAFVKLDGDLGTEIGAVPALVTNAQPVPDQGRVEITLFTPWMQTLSLPTRHGLTGWVEIEVERLSPATLVVRAVNDKLKTSTIKFTPQNSSQNNP